MKHILWKILLAAMLWAALWKPACGQGGLRYTATSGEFKEAFGRLRLHDSLGDSKSQIQDLISISWLFTNAAHLDKSMEFLQKARALCDKTDDSAALASVTLLLGDNYKSIGAFNTAYRYYLAADTLFVHTGNAPFHVFTQFCKAFCKQNEYEHTGAAPAIDTAISLIKRHKQDIGSLRPEHIVPMRLIVIRVLISKSQSVSSESSVEYLKEAIMLSRKGRHEVSGQDGIIASFFMINEADALTRLDSLTQAGQMLREIAEDSLSQAQRAILYPVKCNYYKKTRQHRLALEYFDKSRVLYNNTFNTENANQSHRYLAEMEYHKLMDQYEANKRSREIEFLKINESQKLRNYILKINAIILIAIVALLILNGIILRQVNARLSAAKSEIEIQNSKLQDIHDTMEAQNREIKEHLKTLGEQARISEFFRMRMGYALRLGKSIQDAIMAQPDTLGECLQEHYIYWKPVAPVSGDFYWLRKAGRYSYLAVCDATGHGVPGALLSILGISMMNDISLRLDLSLAETSTGSMLDCLRERFESILGTGSSQISDSIDMALIKIDREGRKIQYSGANRPLVVVSDGEAMEFKPTRMCIGYNVLDRGKFASNIVDFDSGDMVLLFSDGLSDQFGGPDGRTKFGTRRLYEFFSGIYDLPLKVQESAIGAVFQQWTSAGTCGAEVGQIDDQIVLGIRM